MREIALIRVNSALLCLICIVCCSHTAALFSSLSIHVFPSFPFPFLSFALAPSLRAAANVMFCQRCKKLVGKVDVLGHNQLAVKEVQIIKNN